MEIRIMTIDDYDAVHALWMATPGMGLNSLDDSREGIARYLERNPRTCFVAHEKDRLAGVILAGHDGRRGFIYHTAVDTALRRRGIARLLVQTACTALRTEGIAKVALVVFDRNQPGNAFWQSLDFLPRPDLVYRNKVIAEVEMRRMDT